MRATACLLRLEIALTVHYNISTSFMEKLRALTLSRFERGKVTCGSVSSESAMKMVDRTF